MDNLNIDGSDAQGFEDEYIVSLITAVHRHRESIRALHKSLGIPDDHEEIQDTNCRCRLDCDDRCSGK